jgi:hypothetical protein
MRNFLTRLVERSAGLLPTIEPRMEARYGEAVSQEAAPAAAASRESLEESPAPAAAASRESLEESPAPAAAASREVHDEPIVHDGAPPASPVRRMEPPLPASRTTSVSPGTPETPPVPSAGQPTPALLPAPQPATADARYGARRSAAAKLVVEPTTTAAAVPPSSSIDPAAPVREPPAAHDGAIAAVQQPASTAEPERAGTTGARPPSGAVITDRLPHQDGPAPDRSAGAATPARVDRLIPGQAAAPGVRISIGRIEVRAASPSVRPAVPPPRAPAIARTSLAEYMQQSRGRRS